MCENTYEHAVCFWHIIHIQVSSSTKCKNIFKVQL